ncbi:MAG: glycosyltransferase family 2 protein [Schleiferiaceae bacterium]|nr:glycosyltransferase family 2 protein [Schleiferiaceae bacterium]
MKEVAVAVLNWNGKKLLEQFLPSVTQYSTEADVYVIDNASSDDSLAFVRSQHPEVKIIETGDNLGYAGGYNFALQKIENPFVVLLNSDIEVTQNWLQAPLQQLKNNPKLGACQPKIKDYKNQNLFEYAGASGGFIDFLGYPFCRGRVFFDLEEDQGQYNGDIEIFWASGACMFVNREAFWEVGGLDEAFFAHMEEIDLCWRMKNKGYSIEVVPDSVVYHVGGGTLDSQSPNKTFLNFRNSIYLLFKNLPGKMLFPILFARLVLDGAAGVKFILEFKFKHALAIVRAHFAFYGNFARLSKQRRNLHTPTDIELNGIYQKPIVVEHFLGGIKKFSDLKGKFS